MPRDSARPLVGVDTGGTFTDFVLIEDGVLRIHKEPSTPSDPAVAVLRGLRHLLGAVPADVIHGSTVGTNALLERKGARTALVTTTGFEDVLEIGRQTRRSIYDINVSKVPPLVPQELRHGAKERVGPSGDTILPLADDETERVLSMLNGTAPESVAVCFLHSYANPEHEATIARRLRSAHPEWFVTASHEVVPEFREYERCSTTVINAYVGPVMRRYLGNLAAALGSDRRPSGGMDHDGTAGVQNTPGDASGTAGVRVSIMQSNGGVMSVGAARNLSVHTILSGPAGGAVGGFESGKRAGFQNVISFDMGGTSTDVSLAAGALSLTSEGSIGELPVRVPIIDIHTVGAGGGSIAFRDPGGSLRVGPRSAGADPGPICYGRGGKEVTVTDANLFLGRLSAHHFLGGTQALDAKAARDGIVAFAGAMGLHPHGAAEGIIRVANATMERAIRVISLERGHDPRDFALVCFGGAGGMHAADLARGLGIPRVVVPPAAGILSALGMLLADFARDYSRTLLTPLDAAAAGKLALAFAELEKLARGDCESEGVDVDRLAFERSLDMRYVGQGYELTVAWNQAPGNEFNRLHEQRYGYADKSRALEVVNIRLRARGTSARPAPEVRHSAGEDASAAVIDEVVMLFDSREMRAPLVDRDLLQPGNRVMGPALVVEYSTTTVIPPDFVADMDGTGNLVLRLRDG